MLPAGFIKIVIRSYTEENLNDKKAETKHLKIHCPWHVYNHKDEMQLHRICSFFLKSVYIYTYIYTPYRSQVLFNVGVNKLQVTLKLISYTVPQPLTVIQPMSNYVYGINLSHCGRWMGCGTWVSLVVVWVWEGGSCGGISKQRFKCRASCLLGPLVIYPNKSQ